MAQRRIQLQDTRALSSQEAIEAVTRGMRSLDQGFEPTEKQIYDIALERIRPDFNQARHILTDDLRVQVEQGELSPRQAMQELLSRARRGDEPARLQLEGEKGLLALADSIASVGLRQPANVYGVREPSDPTKRAYRIGEGERRYWAYHILALRGLAEFERLPCIIDEPPEDEETVQERQEAENAARRDLPAIARARSLARMKERLARQFRGSETLSSNELDGMVGQRVGAITGATISGRMVRNYLALLTLPPEAQDLAGAADVAERQLRPLVRLKAPQEQVNLVRRIIQEGLTGVEVERAVGAILRPGAGRAGADARVVGEAPVESAELQWLARALPRLVRHLRRVYERGELEQSAAAEKVRWELQTLYKLLRELFEGGRE